MLSRRVGACDHHDAEATELEHASKPAAQGTPRRRTALIVLSVAVLQFVVLAGLTLLMTGPEPVNAQLAATSTLSVPSPPSHSQLAASTATLTPAAASTASFATDSPVISAESAITESSSRLGAAVTKTDEPAAAAAEHATATASRAPSSSSSSSAAATAAVKELVAQRTAAAKAAKATAAAAKAAATTTATTTRAAAATAKAAAVIGTSSGGMAAVLTEPTPTADPPARAARAAMQAAFHEHLETLQQPADCGAAPLYIFVPHSFASGIGSQLRIVGNSMIQALTLLRGTKGF